MTQFKICGIQELEHAEAAVNAGADAIGFVFANSKRKVTVDQARHIAKQVPNHIKKIGVFVNSTKQELTEINREVGLDYVQLHGDESPEFCQSLSLPYIKALRIGSEQDLKRLNHYDNASYFLLDSATGPYRGGNGTTFDWELLKEATIDRNRFILAGGLNEDNIKQAIERTRPTMVDVSSGVETNGVKDPEKIKRLIQKVKERSTCHTHSQM
ncbi:phosphoribosylanthranilate isomerase [Piscibacillus halophilus]|uniref:N-(5'-phosphoribosyl)anthranilate isomerase n=1 Tax=Piscibacillus halophilus TaxID=571933 RepID=A0A1H9DR58_9BACI|nr:phosphoribosylanthranilate isomerase [Piscibacillus halophilus]SEQ15962.1 phosphoribosylanthranilate isomerase [Piscibacillus halophilus]